VVSAAEGDCSIGSWDFQVFIPVEVGRAVALAPVILAASVASVGGRAAAEAPAAVGDLVKAACSTAHRFR